MPEGRLTVVFGGQFGSEGKGALVAYLADKRDYNFAVRVGGTNAGHTGILRGQKVKVQQVPLPCFESPTTVGVIGPAGLVDPDILKREMDMCNSMCGWYPTIIIDRCASLITDEHKRLEADLKGKIGSTCEGVGAATADKVMRRAPMWTSVEGKFAGPPYNVVTDDTACVLNEHLNVGYDVIIEGTQGFGLDLHDSGHYPFCTSRNISPMAILADCGVSHRAPAIVELIMCLRTYPIRVGGNSGRMRNELDWDLMKQRTKGYVDTPEITTVTKRVRRIGEFDDDEVSRAALICRPNRVALMFTDYIDPSVAGKTDPDDVTDEVGKFVSRVEKATGAPVLYLGTGPGTVIDLEDVKR